MRVAIIGEARPARHRYDGHAGSFTDLEAAAAAAAGMVGIASITRARRGRADVGVVRVAYGQ